MAHSWSTGDRFGQYELRRELGRGGMGRVFEAYDTTKDRVVALKLLDSRLAEDPGFRERFRRESHAAARLNEPHVIPIHDWGVIDGTLYIDMRLVPGRDLRGVLRAEGRLEPGRAVGVIAQIAGALDAAHAEGLIHRDVKAENVLLTDNDFAYLVDFGIVQAANETALTSAGGTIGSVAYMAPERFDERPSTAATDVYSLGCLLFECLTGRTPFPAEIPAQAMRAHLFDQPPSVSAAAPDIPPAMDQVIYRALAKDPAARFGSTGELAAAARRALHEPPPTMIATGARPDGNAPWPARTGGVAPPPSPPPTPPGSGGRKIGVLVGGVVGVALLVITGWFVVDRVTDSPGGSATVTTRTTPAPSASTTVPVPSGGSTAEITTTQNTTTPTTTTPTTTTPTTTTQTTTGPEPGPLIGTVPAAGERGFTDGLGPLCLGSEFAAAIGTTDSSRFVICENADGRQYYNGMRLSDGADIQLPNVTSLGAGTFEVVNPADGTTYLVGPAGLTITTGDGRVIDETGTAYAYRE